MKNIILTLLSIPKVGKKSVGYFIKYIQEIPKNENDIIYIFSKENMTGILRSFLRGIWKIMRKREEKENVVCQEVISRERYIC